MGCSQRRLPPPTFLLIIALLLVNILLVDCGSGSKGRGRSGKQARKTNIKDDEEFDRDLSQYGQQGLHSLEHMASLPVYQEQLGRALEIARSSFDGATVQLQSSLTAIDLFKLNESVVEMPEFLHSEDQLLLAITRYARERHYWQYIGMNLERFLVLPRPTTALYRLIEEIYSLLSVAVKAYRTMLRQARQCVRNARRSDSSRSSSSPVMTTDPTPVNQLAIQCEEYAQDYELMLRLMIRPGVLGDVMELRLVIHQFRQNLKHNADAAEFLQVYLYMLTAVQDNQEFLHSLKHSISHQPEHVGGMIRVRYESVINQISFRFALVIRESFAMLRQINLAAYLRRTSIDPTSANNPSSSSSSLTGTTMDLDLLNGRLAVFRFCISQMSEFTSHLPMSIPIEPEVTVLSKVEEEQEQRQCEENLVAHIEESEILPATTVPFIMHEYESAGNDSPGPYETDEDQSGGNEDDDEDDDDDIGNGGDGVEDQGPGISPESDRKYHGPCHDKSTGKFIYTDFQFFWQPTADNHRKPLDSGPILSVNQLQLLCRLRGILNGGPNISWRQLLDVIKALHGTVRKNLRGGSAYTIFLPTRSARFPVRLDQPHPSTRLGYKSWLAARKIIFADYGVDLTKFIPVY